MEVRSLAVKWEEDKMIWVTGQKGNLGQREGLAITLGRSAAALNTRLSNLKRIAENAEIAAFTLVDPHIMLIWQTFKKDGREDGTYISKMPVQAVAKTLGLGYVEVEVTLRLIRDVKHFLYFSGIHSDAPTQFTSPCPNVSQQHAGGEDCSKHSTSSKPKTEKRTLEGKRASSWATKAERALEEGVSLLWGRDTQLWHAFTQMFPRSTTKRVEELYIQEHHVQALVNKYGGTFMQMQLRLQLIRSLKIYLGIAGVHEEKQPFEVETTNDAVRVVLWGVVDTVVEAYTVRCAVHDVMLCLLDAVCTDAADPVPSVPDTEHTFPPSPRPHNITTTTTSTTATTTATPALPLPHQRLSFAFKLHDEGEIWRAHCESQQPQHQSTLAAQVTRLAQTLGCTFAQARDHLNKLINLHLGRYRQLKTLTLLDKVRNEVQNAVTHTNTSTTVQPPVVVATRTAKASSSATTARSRVSQKKMQPPVEMERDTGAEMGYFSTEGESEGKEV